MKNHHKLHKVGHYLIIKPLGKGSFADVFMVKNEKTQEIMAMKRIHSEKIKKDSQLKELLDHEVKILRLCNSENITKFHAFLESDNNIYIIMEYCKDGDMKEFLKKQTKKRVSEKEATNIMKQLLKGFQELHRIGAMHRDFKPENVLIHEGVFKICDFGFGKISKLTATSLGTAKYMAPEIIKYEEYDYKVDIWSLGVVLYEMLFGCVLFWGNNDDEIEHQVLHENLNLTHSEVQISKECKDLLERMLEKNPNNRISWSELIRHPFFTKKTKEELDNNNGLGNSVSREDLLLKSSISFYDKKFNNDILKYKEFLSKVPEKSEIFEANKFNEKISEQSKNEQDLDLEELLKNQDNKIKKKKHHIKKLERKYLFVKNLLNHIAKVIMNGLNIWTNIAHNYGFVIFFKNIARCYETFVFKIKNNNFFNSHYFEEFSKLPFYLEYFYFFENNLSDMNVQLLGYSYDFNENDLNNTNLLKDVKKLFYLDKEDNNKFEELFFKIMQNFIKESVKIMDDLSKNENKKGKKKIMLEMLKLFECLNWDNIFIFDRKNQYGFDFELYEANILKNKSSDILEKIKELRTKLLIKKNLGEFDFTYLKF